MAASWSWIARRLTVVLLSMVAPSTAYGREYAVDADLNAAWTEWATVSRAAQPLSAAAERAPTAPLIDLTEATAPVSLVGADYFDTALVAGNGRLLGLLAPSDRAFYHFVSPLGNPCLFEDPRTLTEMRFHFVNQWIPNDNPVFAGGTAQLRAVQLRFALTERLSIVAVKDGYLWLHPENPAAGDPQGWADLGGGIKYNLIRNPETQTLLSVGFTHEFPSGANRVFQGTGDGEWNLFYSAGQEFFGVAHWVSGAGVRIPNDGRHSGMMWSSNAFDVMLTERWYLMSQVNWFHWYENGGVLPLGFEGNDMFNLGSNSVEGNDIVTASIGGRYKFGNYHETGVAYELPLTERKDLLEGRLYVDFTLRY
jgi:hypothetical protein